MGMILKIMARDDYPDASADCQHQLLGNVISVNFVRDSDGAWARVVFSGQDVDEVFSIPSNAYVLNENGRTISSFSGPKGPKFCIG